MHRLRFDAPAHHVLIEAGERINGGGEFEVHPRRARELLGSRVAVSTVEPSTPADEPVSDEAVTEVQADSATPTDE